MLFLSSAFMPLGLYACKGNCNSPCLVYVSFNQRIYIYWDVQLDRMESTNVLKILEGNSEYRTLLQQLGIGEFQDSYNWMIMKLCFSVNKMEGGE